MSPLPELFVKFLAVLSFIVGWTYMIIWSFSFYLQPYLNWRRKSVVGFSFDYLLMNVVGFSCYSVYTVAFYFSEPMRKEFAEFFGSEPVISLADLGFAVHGIALTLFQTGQCFVYDRGTQTVSWPFKILTGAIVVFIALALSLVVLSETEIITFLHFNWAKFIFSLSLVKILTTLVKYVPQALLNFKRLSTVGWSFQNVLCDFFGGLFSLGQLFIDSARYWSLSPFENLVKLGLSLLALFFDVVFIVQHITFSWVLRIGEGYEDDLEKDSRRASPLAQNLLKFRNFVFRFK